LRRLGGMGQYKFLLCNYYKYIVRINDKSIVRINDKSIMWKQIKSYAL
jgi:hypothetical protein